MDSNLSIFLSMNLFGSLLILGAFLLLIFKDRKNVGYYVAPIAWAINMLAFYLAYFWFRSYFSATMLNTWASVIDLQAILSTIIIGLSLIWEKISRK